MQAGREEWAGALPEIGQVSTRLPSQRTNISGEAPTRNSSSPAHHNITTLHFTTTLHCGCGAAIRTACEAGAPHPPLSDGGPHWTLRGGRPKGGGEEGGPRFIMKENGAGLVSWIRRKISEGCAGHGRENVWDALHHNPR